MDFWPSFIIMVAGEAIAAAIGGLFAYRIAKKRFSQDNLQDGIRCVELLKKILSSANNKGRELLKLLKTRQDYMYSEDGATKFFHKAGETIADLIPATDLFHRTWLRHQEQVWGLSQKNICKKEDERRRNEQLSEELEHSEVILGKLQEKIKSVVKDYEKKTALPNTDPEYRSPLSFLKENIDLWDNLITRLQELSDTCSKLNR